MSAKQIVEEAIQTNKVVVFSKSYCPYCKKSKALLDQLGVEYKVFELDLIDEGADIQGYLFNKTGQRTVPNIFVNKNHVGGNDDLHKAHQNGTLKKLLAESNI